MEVTPKVDAQSVIDISNQNESNQPVRVARYIIEVVYNEADPDDDAARQIKDLSDEFQRALDDGYFEGIRYDVLLFDVLSREVLHVAPAGRPETWGIVHGPTGEEVKGGFAGEALAYEWLDANLSNLEPPIKSEYVVSMEELE